jgi:hypothetical protein
MASTKADFSSETARRRMKRIIDTVNPSRSRLQSKNRFLNRHGFKDFSYFSDWF